MTREKGEKNSSPRDDRRLSRREFARRAAAAAAALAAMPGGILAGSSAATSTATPRPAPAPPQESAGEKPKLSPENLAEIEAKVGDIFRRYGAKLTEEQKADIRRLVREAQTPLEALRAFPLENSDEPATVLRLYRKPAPPGRKAAVPARPAKAKKGGA
jgi:hypothetical protein